VWELQSVWKSVGGSRSDAGGGWGSVLAILIRIGLIFLSADYLTEGGVVEKKVRSLGVRWKGSFLAGGVATRYFFNVGGIG